MPESGLVVVSAAWAVLALLLLGLLAWFAAAVDAGLDARAGGLPVTVGVLRPLDETVRLLRQRRRTTLAADRLLWRIGGGGLVIVALAKLAVVPLGSWTLFDLDVSLVWFNAMDVFVWAVVWLVGWGANSAHSLVGGYRFLAFGLSYELPLMLAIIGPAAAAASVNVGDVVAAQRSLWFVVLLPVAFVVYLIGVVAFSVWGPFSPALGVDVAGGVTAELSSVDRLVFLVGRYSLLATGAAFSVPVFLGGGAGPLLPDWLWTLAKTAVVLFALVWLRRRVAAVRPDLFMEIGWMVLLPAVIVQDFVAAVIQMARM